MALAETESPLAWAALVSGLLWAGWEEEMHCNQHGEALAGAYDPDAAGGPQMTPEGRPVAGG